MEDEIWKVIEDSDGDYEISNYGRVKSYKRKEERILKPSNQKDGYLLFSLYVKGEVIYRKSHRLVVKAFLEPVSGKNYVNHKDGNKKNNHISNLEYCTVAENNFHAGKLNLKPIGTNHTNSKFTHEQLKEIRNLLKSGLSHKKIAKIYSVSKTTIGYIAINKTYSKEPT